MIDITKPVFTNWKIIDKIGEGSYGTVYEIERMKDEFFDSELVQKAALKVISIPKDSDEIDQIDGTGMEQEAKSTYFKNAAQKVYREIEMMAKLHECHNIVRYIDHQIIAHEDGIGYDILLRMELLTPLNKYTKEHELNVDDVIRLGIDICSALEYGEQFDIIHRDIKPANIFVSENGKFKLGDYGIARTASTATVGTVAGAYPYIAPEVFNNEKYDKSIDIYSLGLVLYQYLNGGRLPFMPPKGESIQYGDLEKAYTARLSGAYIPYINDIDESLNKIITKACSYETKKRYQCAKELREALEKYLEERTKEELPVEKPMKKKLLIGAVIAVIGGFALIGSLGGTNSGGGTESTVEEAKSGWVKNEDNSWSYYLEDGTYACNGWKKIEEKYFYFNEDGVVQTGWLYVDGQYYYLNESGEMQVGWQQIHENWFYFTSEGTMVTGTQEIEDKIYHFDSEGILIKE